MAFQPGQSGNSKGRPTKEEIALRRMSKGELGVALELLERAMPKALRNMIAAMDNEDLSVRDRLKYSKDVYDAYLRAKTVNHSLTKDSGASTMDTEDEEDKPTAVVFRIAK